MTEPPLPDFQRWTLGHWSLGGWSIVPDRLRTKKGEAAIERLVKRGFLEKDADYSFHRITPAGSAALGEKQS